MARCHASRRDTRRWTRTVSAIWLPTVNAGFRLVIGSWKIIEISRPRIWRIAPERVAETVTDEVEREHRQRDGDTGRDHAPGLVEHVVVRVLEHGPPARVGRILHTEPEKAQAGLGQKRVAERQRDLHDERRHDVGQHVLADHPNRPDPDRSRGLDEGLLAYRQDLRSDAAHEARGEHDPD